METEPQLSDAAATLDPPGSIAVIGAGPLGIEAALYGRYLGYDVRLFEAAEVAHSISGRREEPIPMMPDRCLSPLASRALDAQAGSSDPNALPLLIGEWIDQVWLSLTETDLLRGRLRCPVRVTGLNLASSNDDGNGDDDVSPDFRLSFDAGESEDFEAVIVATGRGGQPISRSFPVPADYLFEIGVRPPENAEIDFFKGLKEIVVLYASLAGRADLDLYRPQRG